MVLKSLLKKFQNPTRVYAVAFFLQQVVIFFNWLIISDVLIKINQQVIIVFIVKSTFWIINMLQNAHDELGFLKNVDGPGPQ